jgi:hypothetical protein
MDRFSVFHKSCDGRAKVGDLCALIWNWAREFCSTVFDGPSKCVPVEPFWDSTSIED